MRVGTLSGILGRLWTAQPRDDVERELERRTLVSAQRRAAILAWIIGIVFVARAIYQGVYGFRGDDLPGRGYTLLLTGFWVGLEALIYVDISRRIRVGKVPRRFRAYASAAVEVAMPTIMMAIMCEYDRPLNVLTSSVTYLYFFIIILSPLRLDAWLCVFIGALSALGYSMLVAAYAEEITRAWVGTAALMHLTFAMRATLFLSGGLAAGFVSQRIRTTLVETVRQVRERERVVGIFGQHVSPPVANQILSHPSGEHSEMRQVCVMVLDIRNFTTFSETRAADEVVRYLNTLWHFMVRTVNEHHGIVNKFLGDGFLAIFGAPISTDNDCANAIAAAQRIITELADLAAAGALPPTEIGIALHSGPVIVGNIGSADRKEFTIIGDVVNVAFRIEALNKEFGSTLLISEPVRQLVDVEIAERLAPIAIRGRQGSVELFRLA